jgi:hypothetical protein
LLRFTTHNARGAVRGSSRWLKIAVIRPDMQVIQDVVPQWNDLQTYFQQVDVTGKIMIAGVNGITTSLDLRTTSVSRPMELVCLLCQRMPLLRICRTNTRADSSRLSIRSTSDGASPCCSTASMARQRQHLTIRTGNCFRRSPMKHSSSKLRPGRKFQTRLAGRVR